VDGIIFLLPVALLLGAIFAGLFLYAVHRGQFDDLDDPPERILHD
jgi:cbb3-type cytochrome oxidase maturation protein